MDLSKKGLEATLKGLGKTIETLNAKLPKENKVNVNQLMNELGGSINKKDLSLLPGIQQKFAPGTEPIKTPKNAD